MTTSPTVPPGTRLWIGGHDRRARSAIEPLLAAASRPPEGEIDRLILTPLTFDEFTYFARKHTIRLKPAGELWLVTSDPEGMPIRASAARWCAENGLENQESYDLKWGVKLDVWRYATTPPPPPPSA